MKTYVETFQFALGKIALENPQTDLLKDQIARVEIEGSIFLKAQSNFVELLSRTEGITIEEGYHQSNHILEGINKMFFIMYNNTPITSSPADSKSRAEFYKELAKGYSFFGEFISKEFQQGTMDGRDLYATLDLIGDGGHACAGRWKQVLDELTIVFSDRFSENHALPSRNTKPFSKEIQNLFFKSKLKLANQYADEFINFNMPRITDDTKLHYTNFVKRFFNKNFSWNLPIDMHPDPFLGSQEDLLTKLTTDFFKYKNYNYHLLFEVKKLFQDKIDTDSVFRNYYTESMKSVYHKNPQNYQQSDISEFLSKYAFEDYSYKVNGVGFMYTLMDKNFLEKQKKVMSFEKALTSLMSQPNPSGLENFFKKLSPQIFEKEDVIHTLNKNLINGHSALHFSLIFGTSTLSNFLLEKGIDPSKKSSNGTPPIIYAILSKKMDVLRRLIEKDASVNDTTPSKNTPLHYSCLLNEEKITKLLLEKNANVNSKNQDHVTPFMIAVTQKNPHLSKLLIDHGANVNDQNRLGQTPLMTAISLRDKKMVDFLLNHNVNIHLKDNFGNQALDFAKILNDDAILSLLKTHGKNTQKESNRIGSIIPNLKRHLEDLDQKKRNSSKRSKSTNFSGLE